MTHAGVQYYPIYYQQQQQRPVQRPVLVRYRIREVPVYYERRYVKCQCGYDSDSYYSDSGSDSSSSSYDDRARNRKGKPKKKVAVKKPAAKKKVVAKKPAADKAKPGTGKDKDYKDDPLDYAKGDGYYGPYGWQPFPQVWYHHPPNGCCCGCGADQPHNRPRALSRIKRAETTERESTISSASLNLLTKDFSKLGDSALVKLALLAGRGQWEAPE